MHRIVQWDTGNVGRQALRTILARPDFELVGVRAYNPDKVGTDAGQLIDAPDTALRELGNGVRGSGSAEVWTMIPALVVDDEDVVAAARDAMRLAAYSTAHFAFAETFASKNVPDEYQPILREGFARCDYAFHGVAGDANPNLHAFDDHPEVGDYLLDRMVLVGTARTFREQVERLRDDAALDGITFPVSSPAHAAGIAGALQGLV